MTSKCNKLTPSDSRVEKPRQPAATEMTKWAHDYGRWIEQVRVEYQHIKAMEFPHNADLGEGEKEMPDTNYNLVQTQLSYLAQHVLHIVQAGNDQKQILNDEFEKV